MHSSKKDTSVNVTLTTFVEAKYENENNFDVYHSYVNKIKPHLWGESIHTVQHSGSMCNYFSKCTEILKQHSHNVKFGLSCGCKT